MTCGVCGHAVTGETHTKASGKSYVYYHCANADCDERRVNHAQGDLFQQIINAFEPFARFTPKATQAFIDNLHERLQDLDLYTQKMAGELAEKRMGIKESVQKLEKLHAQGILTDAEFEEVVEIKKSALEEVKIELDAYNEADHKTFKEGLRVIELFVKVYNFMKLSNNELDKARLVKIVLSNPTLKNRTIEYTYEKPFDVLLEMTSEKNWWCRIKLTQSLFPHP